MQAGKAQVAGIVYRNICAEYGLEVRKSKWETSPKLGENDRAKIQWDFQIPTDKLVMANQPDIVVFDKLQKKAVLIDVAAPSDSNMKKKEHVKLKNTKDNIGASGNWSTQSHDPESVRVAPTDPRNYIRDLCPDECSSRNS